MNQAILFLGVGTEPVAELLRELSEQGMLRSCLVVDADGAATIVDNGDREKVELHLHLANRPYTLVRVIHLSFGGEPISDHHLAIIAALENTLTPVGVVLEKTSLVLPLDKAMVSGGAFPAFWNHNLLVQPVDMAGEPGFGILPLTDPDKQVVLGAAIVALCGGLWQWLEEGPLDGGRFKGGDHAGGYDGGGGLGANVRIVRAVTRLVDAGDVAAVAVARALSPGVQLPPPAGRVRHGDPKTAVNELLAQVFPKEGASPLGFVYVPYQYPEPTPPTRLGPWRAIELFLQEFWGELRKMPREYLDDKVLALKGKVEKWITDKTFGGDSNIEVRFGNPEDPILVTDPAARVDALLKMMNVEGTPAPAAPRTWTGLVSTVLASADGDEASGSISINLPKWNHQPAVITDFSALAPLRLADDDAGQFTIGVDDAKALGLHADEPIVLGGVDAYGANLVVSMLDRAGHGPASTTTNTAADADESEDGDEAKSKRAKSKASAASGLGALREALSEWIAERDQSLLYRISSGLVAEQQKVVSDISSTTAELESLLKEIANADQVEAANRKWFRRRAFWIIFAFVMTALLAVGAFYLMPVFAIATAVAILLLGWIGSFRAVLRTAGIRVRQRHRRTHLYERPDHVVTRRERAANEYLRLASLYRQLDDWAVVIALALHRPLGFVDQKGEEPWGTSAGALSFISGIPKIDENRIRNTTVTVMQSLATRGWLNRAYARQRGIILEHFGMLAGAMDAGEQAPESDNSVEQGVLARLPGVAGGEDILIYPPRTTLRHGYTEGFAAREYRAEQVEALQSVVLGTNTFDMISSIHCDVVGLNEPERTPTQFLTPIVQWNEVPKFTDLLTPTRQVAGLPVKSIVGISSGLAEELLTARAATINVTPVKNRFTLAAFRIDVSDSVAASDVTIIEAPAAPAAESQPSANDGAHSRFG